MIKLETSARHIHVTKEDLDTLYGPNYQLTKKKDLSQPGQYVCEEKVEVVGPKGSLKMSIMGPERKATQVELSFTDARTIGITAPIRESGDLNGAAPCKVIGPKGTVELNSSAIIAKRHIHMTPNDAKNYNVNNGDIVKVFVNSDGRKLIFDDVVVRVSDNFSLAMHIDTDESNACYGANEATIVK